VVDAVEEEDDDEEVKYGEVDADPDEKSPEASQD